MAVVLFHFVLVVFLHPTPEQSTCPAPAVEKDSIFEPLVAGGHDQRIVFACCVRIRFTQCSTSVLGSSFINSAPMSCAQCPHQPRFRKPTLYRNTVNSGLRATRYSFLSRRAVVCAV